MYYISSASSITHQPTFQNAGFSGTIEALNGGNVLINPDFKKYIEPGLLRRMSKILRMSVVGAKDALHQAGLEQPDSIVVGTGLGCLVDTEKFLNNFLTIEGLLPPTSFIQSTHNTIAGQISLSLGNHGYNMTHTQNSLSFEHALVDALMLLSEGQQHVLVGGADEHIEILDEIGIKFNLRGDHIFTSGVSFFTLSAELPRRPCVGIVDVECIGFCDDSLADLQHFLDRNNVVSSDIDAVLFAESPAFGDASWDLKSHFRHLGEASFINYPRYSGYYATCSAFALHFAVDRINNDERIKNVLIFNRLFNNNLGLMLLQSIEA